METEHSESERRESPAAGGAEATRPWSAASHAAWHGPARRPMAAGVLACLAGLVIVAVALREPNPLGFSALALYAAALLSLAAAGLWWLRRPLPARARLRRLLAERRRQLSEERAALAAERAAIEDSARETHERLAARELHLNNRLVTFHEWMEFPQPLSLAQDEAESRGTSTSELVEKDRRLLKMLDEQTQMLFRKIQQNTYMHEGQFQVALLRDDALSLVRQVALIYQPDATQPLLETSCSQILRSASRICLQALIVMDRLPLNVKEYNLNNLYRYVRQAVTAYEVYKASEPYLPYVNTAYYLGRLAMGGNPVTMGAWWFLSQHGKKMARDFTTRFIQRQVLTLLRDAVYVVGFEAARVYGGDFHRRDANWIYGVELAELVRQVPLTTNSFACALQEVGALQLRNEYDRIFLYRCLAAGQSAQPERYPALETLSSREREQLARRLESFHHAFRLRGTEQKFAEWARGVEQRLGVQLRFQQEATADSGVQLELALRALASYLLDIKQREPAELPSLLAGCRVLSLIAAERREAAVQQLVDDPPFLFDHPEIEPQGTVADAFLADLVRLAVRVAPHLAELDVVLANAAAFLRHDPDDIRRKVEAACQDRFTELCDSPKHVKTRMPAAAVRAALDLVGPGERVQFVYGRVQLEMRGGELLTPPETTIWLMGVADRLVLFALRDDRPRLLWEAVPSETAGADAGGKVEASRVDGWLANACRLRGGAWRDQAQVAVAIVVPGIPLKRFDDYFQPLLAAGGVVSPR